MSFRAYLGDRRAGLRFRVSGELWASIDLRQDVVVHNITAGGALIELTLGPGLRSIRAASLCIPDEDRELLVHVRHASPVSDSPTDGRYRLGLEFVRLTTADRHAIESLVSSASTRS